MTPQEAKKAALHARGYIAQIRQASCVRLNTSETKTLLVTRVVEMARCGKCSAAKLMDLGRTMFASPSVISGVPSIVDDVQVEATFRDGMKLVTVRFQSIG